MKGQFHHEMECGGDKVLQNQVMCPVSVAKLWGYTDIGCDFFEVILCLLGW